MCNRKRPITAVVPFSVIAEDKFMRLDAGHYLGVNEEEDLEKVNTYIKRQSRATWRRWKKAVIAYLKSRYRLWKWRNLIKPP